MEELTCPECGFTSWTIWGEPFESQGTLVILTAECNTEGAAGTWRCGVRMNIGTVDGSEILVRPKEG